MAYLMARYDPDAKEYYRRKLREGKKPFQARVALARNQADIVWSVLTRGTPYVMRLISCWRVEKFPPRKRFRRRGHSRLGGPEPHLRPTGEFFRAF